MKDDERYLLSTRAVVILILAVIIGASVAGLTYLGGASVFATSLAGIFAMGGSVVAANTLVGP